MIPGDPRLVGVLRAALDEQAPDDLVVASGAEVRFPCGPARVADLAVVHLGGPGRGWFSPGEVLLAVEFDVPEAPAVYARHGVGSFWRVVSGPPPSIRAYALRHGAYQQVANASHVLAHAPFPLEIDLAARLAVPAPLER